MSAPPAPPKSSGRGLQVITLIVAVLALVFSVAGVVIAAIALGNSDKATTLATSANSRPLAGPVADPTADPQPADPTAEATTEPPVDPDVTATPGDISPTAQFGVGYQGETLRVQSETCYVTDRVGIDLDEPRVLRGVGDVNYGGCSPGALTTELQIAEIPSQAATPADCLENIRTAPAQSPVAPAKGLTICFLTSKNDAAAAGITQKLVFLTVDSITENNGHGILNITLRAWHVPK